MKRINLFAIPIFISLIFFSTHDVFGQLENSDRDKLTTEGYWIHEKVTEIPGLKTGPFVRLNDGSILTVEKNMSCISDDEGKTWKEYPIFTDQENFEIRIERALIRTSDGVIILAFANEKERANWDFRPDIIDSPGAKLPTYTVRSLDEGKTWQDLQKLHEEWTGANRDIIETKDGNIILSSMIMRHELLLFIIYYY
jgi:sialidase-1